MAEPAKKLDPPKNQGKIGSLIDFEKIAREKIVPGQGITRADIDIKNNNEILPFNKGLKSHNNVDLMPEEKIEKLTEKEPDNVINATEKFKNNSNSPEENDQEGELINFPDQNSEEELEEEKPQEAKNKKPKEEDNNKEKEEEEEEKKPEDVKDKQAEEKPEGEEEQKSQESDNEKPEDENNENEATDKNGENEKNNQNLPKEQNPPAEKKPEMEKPTEPKEGSPETKEPNDNKNETVKPPKRPEESEEETPKEKNKKNEEEGGEKEKKGEEKKPEEEKDKQAEEKPEGEKKEEKPQEADNKKLAEENEEKEAPGKNEEKNKKPEGENPPAEKEPEMEKPTEPKTKPAPAPKTPEEKPEAEQNTAENPTYDKAGNYQPDTNAEEGQNRGQNQNITPKTGGTNNEKNIAGELSSKKDNSRIKKLKREKRKVDLEGSGDPKEIVNKATKILMSPAFSALKYVPIVGPVICQIGDSVEQAQKAKDDQLEKILSIMKIILKLLKMLRRMAGFIDGVRLSWNIFFSLTDTTLVGGFLLLPIYPVIIFYYWATLTGQMATTLKPLVVETEKMVKNLEKKLAGARRKKRSRILDMMIRKEERSVTEDEQEKSVGQSQGKNVVDINNYRQNKVQQSTPNAAKKAA